MTPPPDDLGCQADPTEEAFAQRLADWDERHASGKSTAASLSADETPVDGDLHERLERAQACLKLLKQLWSPSPAERRNGDAQRSADQRAYARFGRYEIVRELGRGGHGVVLLAADPVLRRHVALKVPRPEVLASEEMSRRFLREAEAAARLDHPGILPVFEVGTEGPICFTAAAYCDGGTLQEWLAQGRAPLDPRQAAQIVAELAAAIHHAHTRGVLHRDLKPSNVLLVSRDQDSEQCSVQNVECGTNATAATLHAAPGTLSSTPLLDYWVLKIADFGLAKVADGQQDSTMNGIVMGTANYMAPEQADGRAADVGVATDVYSLGVILYELLTGAPPFLAATSLATLKRVERDEAAWPSKIRGQLPSDLKTVCLTCLEKDPGRRYGSAAALAADLRRFLAGEPVTARPLGLFERASRAIRRRPALSVLSAMAACLAIGFVIQLDRHNRDLTHLNSELEQKIAEHETLTADAKRLQGLAETRAEENRRRSFGADLRLAQQFADAGSLRQLTRALHATIPQPEGHDLREFAWRYWWHRCRRAEFFVLPGHASFVHDAECSPDGRWIATCSSDSTVRIWQADIGRELTRLYGMQEEVRHVAFSPDGKLLAAGDNQGGLKVWTTGDWRLRHALRPHAGAVRGLGFPDNERLVSGGDDAEVRVWDLNAATIIDRHGFSNGRRITSLVASPKGNLLLIGFHSGEIQLRPLDAVGTLLDRLPGHQWDICGLAVSLRGDRVFSCDVKGNLRLWDLAARRTIYKSPENLYRLSRTALSPDGQKLAAVTEDARVQILDVASGTVQYERKLEIDSVGGLAFSPDGQAVFVGGSDGLVALWQPAGQCHEQPQGHDVEVWSVAFAANGRTFVTGSDDESLKEWETATGRLVRTIVQKHPGTVAAVAYSPDGKLLATTSLEELKDLPDNVRLWKMPEGELMRTMSGHAGKAYSAAFHPSGGILATGSREVILWDVSSGLRIDTLSDSLASDKKVKSIAFSPDGLLLAFASEDGNTYLYDSPSLTRRHVLASGGEVWCVAFSPDSKSLAAGNRDGDVAVWNPLTGKKKFDLKGHLQGVRCVAFTHDGQTIATGSDDDTIKLWGPVTGQEFCTLSGHANDVYTLAFSPDDQWLVSGSYDGAVKLWHAPLPPPMGSAALRVKQGATP